MTSDMDSATQQPDHRVDRSSRTHRGWQLLTAVLIAAAVIGLALGIVRNRITSTSPTGTPSSPQASAPPAPVARFSSSGFVHPFTWTPPAWTAINPTGVDSGSSNHVVWTQSGCVPATPCYSPIDYKIRVIAPVGYFATPEATTQTASTSYAGFLAHLNAQQRYGVRIADTQTLTVGGRPATLMTLTATSGDDLVEGALGCERSNDTAGLCWGPDPSFQLRLAVIDTTGGVTLAWLRATKDNPDADHAFEEFETALRTLTWNA